MSEKSQVKVYLPGELHELLNADRRSNSEVVKAALWREFGGERMGAVERRIEEQKRRISMIESERNERNRELEESKEKLEALKKKKDEVSGWKEQRENEIGEAAEALRNTPLEPGNPGVRNWAEKLGMSPMDLIKELEARK